MSIFHKDQKNYRILIVEDNPGDVALIEEYLSEYVANSSLHFAHTFEKAKNLLSQPSFTSDVILLDLSLPDQKGEPLVREIVALAKRTPVIVLTGLSDIEFSLKTLSFGVSDYLLKDELNPSSLYKSIIYTIERKKTALELEESRKQYSDLFQLSPLPVWVFDAETLRFLDVNQATLDHYGYSKEEFDAFTILDIRPEDQGEIAMDSIRKANEATEPVFRGVLRHKKKSGKVIDVQINSTKIVFNGRDARLVLATDITEQLQYIDAIEAQNQKLREIAWTQSHVVRAPLARIMGLVNLMDEMNTSDLSFEEFKQLILKSAHELDQIIRDITEKTALIKVAKK